MKSLRNTKVLITGGTSEIGQEIAGRLVVGGAHVAIKCRRREEDAGDTGALIHQASVHSASRRLYAEFSAQSSLCIPVPSKE